ncbi:MAG: recombinase family protein [Oscillospiraceae bacterium]|nr:recombinase family protein [Oscillospiraceae bacterium]
METGIYVRVSTEEQAQEGFSIRAQEQKLKDFTRIKDWSIFKIYADEGISGKNITQRPAMCQLVEDVKAGRVKNVLVFKIDRLTRSTADLIYLVDLFNEYGCAFNSLCESIDTQTASGRMFLKIIGIFAEFERENIIERTKLGVERKVKEGYTLCTATPSFGFDRPKGEKIQTINEEEALIVREIFDLYVQQGKTLTDIARQLNLRKISTKHDAAWSSVKIRRVLCNVNYVGEVRHHVGDKQREYSVDGRHEGFIPQDLFEAAQRLLAKNYAAAPKRKPRPDNYFVGFLFCAQCGYRLKTHNQSKAHSNGTVQHFGNYVCGNKTLRTCTAGSMSHSKLEVAFEEYIAHIADFTTSVDTQNAELAQKQQQNQTTLHLYEEKLRQFEAKARETLDLYVNNDIAFAEYREIKQKLAQDREFVQSEIKRLREQEERITVDDSDIIRNLRENWGLLTNAERRQFLINFVERIVAQSEKMDGKNNTVRVLEVVFKAV